MLNECSPTSCRSILGRVAMCMVITARHGCHVTGRPLGRPHRWFATDGWGRSGPSCQDVPFHAACAVISMRLDAGLELRCACAAVDRRTAAAGSSFRCAGKPTPTLDVGRGTGILPVGPLQDCFGAYACPKTTGCNLAAVSFLRARAETIAQQ